MRRNIIKQGNNSYTLTLPIKWIRENKLDVTGEVEVNEEEGDVIVSIPKNIRSPESKINIDLNDFNERTIRNILNQAYRKGYDQILLKLKDKKQLRDIRRIVKVSLLGFEVVEEKEKECLIQNIAEPSSDKFRVILRKIFLLIENDGKEILEDFRNKKLNNLKKREETREIIDTYTNFCRRLIIKDKVGGTKNSYLMILIISRLSLIYHAYYYMYKSSSSKKIFLNKEILSLLEKTNELFNLFYETFYKTNLEKAHKIGVLKDQMIYNTLYDLLQKTKGKENIVLYHLGEIIRLIHISSTNIFGLIEQNK
jgi:phosphate uptake regulator|tara:strand:- start:1368 stop:2297 length:930 start_codon:yes stop_codon:yes gene_type:complete